jgi:hypothetical protein
MIVETGVIVFLSLLVLVWRLPRRTMLKLFGTPWLLELPFGVLAYVLHYGTFSGMMAAAVAAILCFGFVQAARSLVGYIKGGTYYPGTFTLEVNPKR